MRAGAEGEHVESISAQFRRLHRTAFLLCGPRPRRCPGRLRPRAIVNVTSHQARQAVPGSTPYVTAKAAIEGLTRALAVEYGPYGIRVNAVAPDSVETERYTALLAEHDAEDPTAGRRADRTAYGSPSS